MDMSIRNYAFLFRRKKSNEESKSRAKLLKWTLGCLLCFVSEQALTATYYVDPSLPAASDLNAGTSMSAPWKTLGRVGSQTLNPGDIVSVKKGTAYTGGFYLGSKSGASGNPITINTYGTGNKPEISNASGDAILLDHSHYFVIDGFMLVDSQRNGIYLYASNNNIVRNSEMTRVGIGVYSEGSSNLITGNYAHDLKMIVNTPGGDDDYGAVGFVVAGINNEVSYNRAINCKAASYDYGQDGGAIEFWKTVDGAYVHHNYGLNNNGFLEAGGETGDHANDTKIAYNVSIKSGSLGGVHLTGGGSAFGITVSNFRVENNTFYEPDSGTGFWIYGGTLPNDAINFRNNIITLGSGNVFPTTAISHSYNLFDLGATATITPGSSTLDTGDKLGSPLYTDVSTNNFHLLSGSPAIDAATNLGYTLDFDNTPVPSGAAPDMGAYEYVAPPTNLLVNGSFDSAPFAPWTFTLSGGVTGTQYQDSSTKTDGAYSEAIQIWNATPGASWNAQLSQALSSLPAGKTVTISFSAKASVARQMDVGLQQSSSPWTWYGLHTFSITQSFATYSFTFTMPTTAAGVLHFNLGDVQSNIWLDNVIVTATP